MELDAFLNGEPATHVSLETDNGKSILKASVYANESDKLLIEWVSGGNAVVLTRFRRAPHDKVLTLVESAGVDIAADDRPVRHSAPFLKGKVIDSHWGELTTAVEVPLDDFVKLASSKSLDIRVAGEIRALSDNELAILKIFVRRMAPGNG